MENTDTQTQDANAVSSTDLLAELSFEEALQILNIEDFRERILSSNSHGELLHCYYYIQIAQLDSAKDWFRPWFMEVVKWAEDNWERPDSVFQHMPRLIQDAVTS